MGNLTEAQDRALRYALYSRAAGSYYVNPELTSKTTMKVLEREGYIDESLSDGYRWWLTESGLTKREELVNETCPNCGQRTHHQESACVHCGVMKQWAE